MFVGVYVVNKVMMVFDKSTKSSVSEGEVRLCFFIKAGSKVSPIS